MRSIYSKLTTILKSDVDTHTYVVVNVLYNDYCQNGNSGCFSKPIANTKTTQYS